MLKTWNYFVKFVKMKNYFWKIPRKRKNLQVFWTWNIFVKSVKKKKNYKYFELGIFLKNSMRKKIYKYFELGIFCKICWKFLFWSSKKLVGNLTSFYKKWKIFWIWPKFKILCLKRLFNKNLRTGKVAPHVWMFK